MAAVFGSTALVAEVCRPDEPPTLRLALTAELADSFSTLEPPSAEERALAEAVVQRLPGLAWSTALARSAALYASTTTGLRSEALLPDLLEEVLLRAGCPDPYVEGAVLQTPAGGLEEVLVLARQLTDAAAQPFTHVGLGRATDAGGWRWALLLSRRLAEVEPFPAELAAGDTAELRFRLGAGLRTPQVAVIRPGATAVRPTVRSEAGGFGVTVEAGPHPGVEWLQVTAEDGHSEVLAAMLRVVVGGASLPTFWEGDPFPEHEAPASPAEAERLLACLVDAERARHGLLRLEPDPVLAAVARSHSADMRDVGFFGHLSPTRGDLAARLGAAGYQAKASRENVARAATVHAAHLALMASPGHRANLLWPEMTRRGVGVALTADADGHQALLVTEIFALPPEAPTPAELRRRLVTLVAAARAAAELVPLAERDLLDRWAERLAREAAHSGHLDPKLLAALQAELGGVADGSTRSVHAELSATSDPSRFHLPPSVTLPDARELGLGVAAEPAAHAPQTYTVVLVVVAGRGG